MRAYRRAWIVTSRALVAVGGAVALLIWCVASPWTFAVVLAAACWGHRRAAAAVADTRHRQLLRVLPALALAAVGWSMLAGAAGAALLLVAAAFGLPVLAGERFDRWPDGRHLDHIPDTVEELAPTAVETPAMTSTSPSWSGPRTLLPDLDDDELQHAWDSSTRALQLGPGPAALLRIVTARARYLDALDERDPDGLARRLVMGERDQWTSFDSPA